MGRGASRGRFSRRRLGGAVALSMVAGVLLMGCGKNETTDLGAAPTTSVPPRTTAPPTTVDRAADASTAKKALLVVGDLPGSGWAEGKAREKDSSTTGEMVDTCPDLAEQLKEFKKLSDSAAEAKSPKLLNKARQVDLDEDVVVFANEDESTTIANVFGDRAFATCLRETFAKKAKDDPSSGVDPASITVDRVAVGKLGDDHTVFRLTLGVSDPKTSKAVTVHVVFALVRVGRGYVSVDYTTTTPADMDADVMPILKDAADKLRRQLAS